MDFQWIFHGIFHVNFLPFEVEDVSAAKELLGEGRRKKQEELANEEKKRCSAKRQEISTQKDPIGTWYIYHENYLQVNG